MKKNEKYLTPALKQSISARLEELYPTARNDDPCDGLDITLVPYLKRINNIEGMATTQSCIGHWNKAEMINDVQSYHVMSGCLWIHASEVMSEWLYRFGDRLTTIEGIEVINIKFQIYVGCHFKLPCQISRRVKRLYYAGNQRRVLFDHFTISRYNKKRP